VPEWDWRAEVQGRRVAVTITMTVRPFDGWEVPQGVTVAELAHPNGRVWRCRGAFLSPSPGAAGTGRQLSFRSESPLVGRLPDYVGQQNAGGAFYVTLRAE
jgi:hypothetical protein